MISLALALASLAIKSSLLLSLVLLIATHPGLSAADRYSTLFAGLLATLVLPVLSLCVPGLHTPLLASIVQAPITPDHELRMMLTGPLVTRFGLNSSPGALAVLLVWVVGTCLFMGRVILSWGALYALLRRGRPVRNMRWLILLDECCENVCRRRPLLLSSDETDVALACGWLMPVIVLPAEAAEWPQEQLRDVLLHELSHIARHDALTLLMAQVARALYFWNPLAILAERRMREEREYACDDRVLTGGRQPDGYAATLVDVAECLSGHARPVAPAMAHRSLLEKRVLAILDSARSRGRTSVTKAVVVGVPALVLLLTLAALRAVGSERVDSNPDAAARDKGTVGGVLPGWTVSSNAAYTVITPAGGMDSHYTLAMPPAGAVPPGAHYTVVLPPVSSDNHYTISAMTPEDARKLRDSIVVVPISGAGIHRGTRTIGAFTSSVNPARQREGPAPPD